MKMAKADIGIHLRTIIEVLNKHGYSPARRAGLVGRPQQSLKQYLLDESTPGYRLISSKDLATLREEAERVAWEATFRPLSDWTKAEGFNSQNAMPPIFKAIDKSGVPLGSHIFLPRALELAENSGGYVVGGDAAALVTDGARLRSRWRRAVYRLRKLRPETAFAEMCELTGYCEYAVGRIGIEFPKWRLGVTKAMAARMEERTREYAA